MKCAKLLSLVLLLGLLLGCTPNISGSSGVFVPSSSAAAAPQTQPSTSPPSLAERILGQMSLRQKVGQLFLIRPDALDPEQTLSQVGQTHSPGVTQATEPILRMLKLYPVGGIILFSKNIQTADQVKALNADLQAASTVPLFLSVDEEGGSVARLAQTDALNLPQFESAAAVGAQGTDAVLNTGRTIGGYLRELGFNMDFAPVADVNTNPSNPVIGNRAFSSDPVQAAVLARAMADGLTEQGIIPVFKHFPGHGDTAQDSHIGLAVSEKPMDALEQCELLPFRQASAADCVMVGHIALPQVTGDLTATPFCAAIVRELLKEGLGFQGLVITDSMEMGAVRESYPAGEDAVAALKAGCDVILMPYDLEANFQAVLTALETGELSSDWLDETVLRILEFKDAHGLLEG